MIPEVKQQDGFPSCVSLSIHFNDHALIYESVEEWMADDMGGQRVSWASEEERKLALENNSVWTCNWYPTTPIGSYEAGASSFPALMAFIAEACK